MVKGEKNPRPNPPTRTHTTRTRTRTHTVSHRGFGTPPFRQSQPVTVTIQTPPSCATDSCWVWYGKDACARILEVETPPQEVTHERDSPTKCYLVFMLCFTHKTGSRRYKKSHRLL